jgi:hypothetical protein
MTQFERIIARKEGRSLAVLQRLREGAAPVT